MCLAHDDRGSKSLTKPFNIDTDMPCLSNVPHVQNKNHRQLQIENLTEQVEIPFEVGRIDDTDDAVQFLDVTLAAEQDVHRDHFVRGSG